MPLKRIAPPAGWFPKRGEVCLLLLDKERPALVVSSDSLNRHSLDICVVPISTAEHKAFSPKFLTGSDGILLIRQEIIQSSISNYWQQGEHRIEIGRASCRQ